MSGLSATSWPKRATQAAASRAPLVLATALLLIVLAPWRTGNLPLLHRAAEFLTAAFVWELAVAVVAGPVSRSGLGGCPPPLPLIATVAAASVPATSAIAIGLLLSGSQPGQLGLLYPQSLLLGLLVASARRGLRQRPAMPANVAKGALTPGRQVPSAAAAFLRRHAPALAGQRLLALQSEDHYLRIHVAGGSDLVLLRMRDAVAELGQDAGWQPHRSFWLAADAGGQAKRRGQAWQIVLDTGLTVPVSKPAVPIMHSIGYAPDS